ncbi:NAD(P)-dependent oxidoreductase [Parasphaerochaeta coccoides]|uniref:Phosphoglycerate dehydrogenase n=1 Tax=Parasphaerochaeta coccoides (strain ATCC BAA-1237 / DSM 17374 / SPN1) TaxID=760011 RepID=F4GIC2_PARC1|nr:NAD(P)-dependent oxidoreductase [Parasphaerochaeta coccoides]AEC01630.1 Phosphoglycerate dehydrogenase [Parasphaerochaeta coccoides DSM 17374]
MLILIADAFDTSLPKQLSRFGEVTSDPARLGEADIVLVRSKTKCTSDWMAGAPRVKAIIRGGVGMDNIDMESAASKGILTLNTPTASSIAVAELAFSLMLAVPNHISEYDAGMKSGKWLKNLKRTELYGKTIALLGMGNIATEVAKRALAFGMKVVAYDCSKKGSPYAEMKDSVEDAVRDADYVSVHLPLNAATNHLVDRKLLEVMTRKPVIINTARGLCIDAQAMVDALENGQVSWYAADVYPSDPPSPDYPLLKCEHVTLTPHVGANSEENLGRIGDEVVRIIERLKDEGKV